MAIHIILWELTAIFSDKKLPYCIFLTLKLAAFWSMQYENHKICWIFVDILCVKYKCSWLNNLFILWEILRIILPFFQENQVQILTLILPIKFSLFWEATSGWLLMQQMCHVGESNNFLSHISLLLWLVLKHTGKIDHHQINAEHHTVQTVNIFLVIQWRHNNKHDGISNHQPHNCLLNRLFKHRSKKTSKHRITGLCEGNSPATDEFPTQRASNMENVSIWWHHHVN